MEHKHYIRLKDGSVICLDDIVYISQPLSNGVSRAIVLRGWDRYENINSEEDYLAIVKEIKNISYNFTDCINKESNGEDNVHKDLR